MLCECVHHWRHCAKVPRLHNNAWQGCAVCTTGRCARHLDVFVCSIGSIIQDPPGRHTCQTTMHARCVSSVMRCVACAMCVRSCVVECAHTPPRLLASFLKQTRTTTNFETIKPCIDQELQVSSNGELSFPCLCFSFVHIKIYAQKKYYRGLCCDLGSAQLVRDTLFEARIVAPPARDGSAAYWRVDGVVSIPRCSACQHVRDAPRAGRRPRLTCPRQCVVVTTNSSNHLPGTAFVSPSSHAQLPALNSFARCVHDSPITSARRRGC
jgi:hypothetical protein